MNDVFENRILSIFRDLNRIPRESGNEKAVSDFIMEWALERGLQAAQDEYNNLIIRKPASPGCEDHEAVLLQAHMDMVCEKNADSTHDFSKDPIDLKVEGDWLMSARAQLLVPIMASEWLPPWRFLRTVKPITRLWRWCSPWRRKPASQEPKTLTSPAFRPPG